MHIAILLLCHNNPEKINKLISALEDDEIDIYIHVDKKSNIEKSIIISSNHIKILPDELRINVMWAQFSQVEAEINLLNFAAKNSNYDYYILLSGADYPIVSLNDLKKYLESNYGCNFINLYNSLNYNNGGKTNHHDKCNDIAYSDWILTRYGIPRIIRRLWVVVTGGYNYTFSIFKRKYDSNIKFYFGSQWWCFNGEFVDWMLKELSHNNSYIAFFRKCSTPDESFFHTLFMNSDYASTRKDYLHYIDWSLNLNSPKNLTMNDYDKIIESNKFFARKIFDDSLMKKIDYIINK